MTLPYIPLSRSCGPTTQTLSRFQDNHRKASLQQARGNEEPNHPRPYDNNIPTIIF